MTPKEFLLLKFQSERLIASIKADIRASFQEARMCKTPHQSRLRKARAKDVVQGAILWKGGRAAGFQRWILVERVSTCGELAISDGTSYRISGLRIEK